MLIVSRKTREKIILAEQIEITVLGISHNRVRFGINAPADVFIDTRLKRPDPFEPVGVVAGTPETPPKVSNVTPLPGARDR